MRALARQRLLAVLVASVFACVPAASGPASSPSPTLSPRTSSTSAAPSTTASSTAAPARITVSDVPIMSSAGAFLLFQLPGETRLRAISFDAAASGVLAAQVPSAFWSQAPYGEKYVVGTAAYDREGKPIGAIPWTSDRVAWTWSTEGRFLCAVVPGGTANGAPMRLETAFLGQAPKVVATGFGALFDNAGYQVLACDEGSDRAIVGFFGQGLYAARLWVFRLSTGAIVRSVDYGGADVGRWVAASPDASLIAESVQSTAASPIKVTIRAADNGAALGMIDDFTVQGFSGNNAYVVGGNRSATSVIDWKSGHPVWSGTGAPYGGHLAEPAGDRFAVGLGFTGGSDVRDVYLVGPGGTAVLLPTGVKVSLRY